MNFRNNKKNKSIISHIEKKDLKQNKSKENKEK